MKDKTAQGNSRYYLSDKIPQDHLKYIYNSHIIQPEHNQGSAKKLGKMISFEYY
jgi:hypothetical protein